MISFIYISNRKGSLDLLGSSMVSQKKRDGWELVVVDGCPGRWERGTGIQYLNGRGIPLGWYGMPKPKTFPHSRTGFVNAMNTGLMRCRGDYVVFLHDYTVYPDEMVLDWEAAFDSYPKTLIHGSGKLYILPEPDNLGDLFTWSTNDLELRHVHDWVPSYFEVGYWGGPIEFFLGGNGIDERADFCAYYALNSVLTQAWNRGWQLKVLPGLICHMVDHKQWRKSGDEDPLDPRHTLGTCSDVVEEPAWTVWAANPYNLRDERKKFLEGL